MHLIQSAISADLSHRVPNYMIMSLQKYGLIKGLKKGIDRLRRCNINDGDFDLP